MSKPNLGRILRWVWTVIGGILTFVGLGGAPDDIEGRKQIFDSINTDAIAAFLAGDGGRWTTFIAGISLVVAANRGRIRSLFPSTNRDLPDSNDNAPTVTIYRHILAPERCQDPLDLTTADELGERCQDPLDLTTADELGERLCARCLSQPIVDLQRPTRNGLGLMELQSMSQ